MASCDLGACSPAGGGRHETYRSNVTAGAVDDCGVDRFQNDVEWLSLEHIVRPREVTTAAASLLSLTAMTIMEMDLVMTLGLTANIRIMERLAVPLQA